MREPKKDIAHLFGSKVRHERESKNISQQRLADEVGIARESIINYEAGKHSPSLEVAEKIADHLGVKLQDLLLK